jgi:hypothetical protein
VAINKCFEYMTQIYGNDASIEVILLKYGKNSDNSPTNQTMSLLKINGTISKWTRITINIKNSMLNNTNDFAFRIKGKFTNPKSFIALDDIRLINSLCAPSDSGLSYCSDGTQLNDSQICNFVNDCPRPPYDDEINCGVCDFEKSILYFYFYKFYL